jgi:formate hydrogenlyase subunit 6/NADH:ubiquinone oxidoreductase subunit I
MSSSEPVEAVEVDNAMGDVSPVDALVSEKVFECADDTTMDDEDYVYHTDRVKRTEERRNNDAGIASWKRKLLCYKKLQAYHKKGQLQYDVNAFALYMKER